MVTVHDTARILFIAHHTDAVHVIQCTGTVQA